MKKLFHRRSFLSVVIGLSVAIFVLAASHHGVQSTRAATFSITGAVYKYSATPGNVLSGANIMAMNLDPMQGGSSGVSGSDGTFTIANLQPGTYKLQVSYFPMGGGAPQDLVAPTPAPITISTGDSTGNTIVFEQAKNTITGTVYRSDGTTPIASAQVNIFSTMGSFFRTTTNSSGVYSQKVGSGDYMAKAEAETGTTDWVYQGAPVSVSFTDNTGTSQTVDFVTATANVTLTGTLKMPDGTAATSSQVFAMISAGGAGYAQGIFPDSGGNFSIKVATGSTYSLMIFPSFTYSQVTAPRLDPIKVTSANANSTVALGTINLVNKTDTIVVTVKDENNAAVNGVQVTAMQTSENGVSEGRRSFFGGSFAQGTTNSSGQATLYVTPGTWSVRGMPPFNGGLAYAPSAAQSVSVTAGTAASASLTMKVSNATITGKVVGPSGEDLPSVSGYVSLGATTGTGGGDFYGGLGAPIMGGQFTIRAPAGTYPVNVFLSPGSGYSVASGATVTVAANQTATLTGSSAIQLVANNATISGSLKDTNGTTLTKTAQVFAQDDKGNFSFSMVSGGSYSLKVAPGNWKINFSIGSGTGYIAANGLTYAVTATANQTTTQNLTVRTLDSTISGTTKKADGTAVAGAYVMVDSRGASIKKSGESSGMQLGNSAVSDASGNWSLQVPAGTYEVRATMPLSEGLINPKPIKVTTSATTAATGTALVFGTSNATITGTASIVTASSVSSTPMTYVTAFSNKGGYTEAQANSSGAFTLNVTNDDTWHLIAIREDGTTLYRNTETTVTLNSTATTATQDLSLRLSTTTMPQQASVTCSMTQTCTLALSDGTQVVAPGGAFGSSGNATITATPKAQLPVNKDDHPIGDYGVDFTATNDSGQSIATFNSPVTITMPYTDASLTAAGITAADLMPKSWDTSSGSWQAASGASVDTTNKKVQYSTNHFTNFAITASASSIPTTSVSSPTDGTNVSKTTADIAGTVSDPAATVTIKVGTTDQGTVTVDSTTGVFTKTVTLASGQNTVTITSTNVVGSSNASLTLTNIAPTITKLSLSKFKVVTKKGKTEKLSITGAYFVKGATVKIGSSQISRVTFKNSTLLSAFIPADKIKPGKYAITVTNPDGGTVTSTAKVIAQGPKPTVTFFTPTVVKAKKTGYALITIHGTNFLAGTTVLIDGKTASVVKVAVVSAKVIRVTVKLSAFKKGKFISMTVTLPDDQKVVKLRAVKGK